MVIFSTTENNMIHAYIYICTPRDSTDKRNLPKGFKGGGVRVLWDTEGDININCKRKTKGKSFALCHLCFWDWLVRTLLQPCSIRILEIVKDMMWNAIFVPLNVEMGNELSTFVFSEWDVNFCFLRMRRRITTKMDISLYEICHENNNHIIFNEKNCWFFYSHMLLFSFSFSFFFLKKHMLLFSISNEVDIL